MFIYRIIERCWTKRRFRKRHEDFFEKNIQLVLHEFAKMQEEIVYKEVFNYYRNWYYWKKILKPVKETLCYFADSVWNIICQKHLKDNDFKRDREKKK